MRKTWELIEASKNRIRIKQSHCPGIPFHQIHFHSSKSMSHTKGCEECERIRKTKSEILIEYINLKSEISTNKWSHLLLGYDFTTNDSARIFTYFTTKTSPYILTWTLNHCSWRLLSLRKKRGMSLSTNFFRIVSFPLSSERNWSTVFWWYILDGILFEWSGVMSFVSSRALIFYTRHSVQHLESKSI